MVADKSWELKLVCNR